MHGETTKNKKYFLKHKIITIPSQYMLHNKQQYVRTDIGSQTAGW
jgi:hypothetical protein